MTSVCRFFLFGLCWLKMPRRIAVSVMCLGVAVLVTALWRGVGGEPYARAQGPVGDGQTDPFVGTVAAVRPSIAAIGSYYFKDKPTVQYVGTGFVIGDGRSVVTNAHVVDSLKSRDRIKYLRVFFPDERAVDGRQATVWAYDAMHDVCILRFEGSAVAALQLEHTRQPAQGLSVGILGYPIGLHLGLVPAAHRGVVAAVVPAVLPLPKGARMTPQLAEAIRDPYNLYQLDLVVYPGNSGSPVFDVRGSGVLGIINKTLAAQTREHLLDRPSGIGYAVPARWIHELWVRGNSIPETDRVRELKRLGLAGE
jgi:serine protease Do